MTESRASEDYRPTFPVMTELFGRPGVPMSAEQIASHEKPADPIGDLLVQAENASSPEWATAYAQIATARAIREQTEELRITNKILSEVGL